jgi:hypothetical protein
MMFWQILILMIGLSSFNFSQTLFEDALSSSAPNSPQRQALSSQKKSVVPQKTRSQRNISVNLLSLIARGDIQLLHETPQNNGWSTMVSLHVNPQKEFSEQTGDLGAAIGGRMYLENSKLNRVIFLQGLVGFNHTTDRDLVIAVEIGRRFQWNTAVAMDVSIEVNRSYAPDFMSPRAYLKTNLTFFLDRPILPFL